MEHLKIPPGATHIHVPYKCTQPYDGGDFFEYPTRQGWTKEELLGQNEFGGRTTAQIEAFFQTWLYFGTLICVFKLQGIDIDSLEFLRTDEESGEVFVTTAGVLTKNIQAWRVGWVSGDKDRDCEEAKATLKILEVLSKYMGLYCGVEGRENEDALRAPTGSTPWPVAGEIAMSIIALGYILSEAASEIYERTKIRWGASPMLKSKLLENGWCALDVRRFVADVAIDGQYYLVLKECPYDKDLHRGCTGLLCRTGTGNQEPYVIQHVEEKCDGLCRYDTTTEDVVRVIENGGIPVVSWRKDFKGDGSRLVVEDASAGGITYVAISHVWADGLGNPNENSLPTCQLSRIQEYIDALIPETETKTKTREHPISFWMDTLCIPASNKHEHIGNQSIQMMRQIYSAATAVLVLDAGLQTLPLSSSTSDISIAVYMSNWMHRLWTFQEGMLAQRLYFQLRDGALYKEDFEDHSVAEEEADQEGGLYGSFQSSARMAALGHFVIIKGLAEMKMGGNGILFPPLCHAIQQRTTMYASDEAICAATILDMDLRDILAVEKRNIPDGVVAEQRMEIFFKQLGEFAPGVIFHHQKRLRTEGYRWAPRSVMGAQPMEFARDIDKDASLFTGEGLRVEYPGFVLEDVPPGSGNEVIVVVKQGEDRYRVRVFPEDDDSDTSSPMWDTEGAYAVVMFRSVSARYLAGTDAIVGRLKDPTGVRDKQATRRDGAVLDMTVDLSCECRAWVEPLGLGLEPSMTNFTTVKVELLGEKQAWHVF